MAQEKKSKVSILTNGIIKENPVLRLVLGTCSTLAVTTAVSSALGMGAAFTFVLVCANIMISLLRKVIPGKVHLPCYIVIIAGFVTIVQMFMQAYMESLYNALGVFLPLIVVNCIILGRAEMFACKNSVVDSALDGIGMGIGYTLTVVLMATIREILGSGTWLGFKILPDSVAKIGIMTQAPGAFFCFGLLMAGCVWLEGKLDARIERKSCCDIDNLKKEAESDARQTRCYLLQHDPCQQLRAGEVLWYLPVPGRFQKAGLLRWYVRRCYLRHVHGHGCDLPHPDLHSGSG